MGEKTLIVKKSSNSAISKPREKASWPNYFTNYQSDKARKSFIICTENRTESFLLAHTQKYYNNGTSCTPI